MSKVIYEFVLFSSPRAQTGIVLAHPLNELCPCLHMVMAAAWELKSGNPMIHVAQSPVTKGILEGICNATHGAIYGNFTKLIEIPGNFQGIGMMLGIKIEKDFPTQEQFTVASTDLLPYLREELKYIAELQENGYYEAKKNGYYEAKNG